MSASSSSSAPPPTATAAPGTKADAAPARTATEVPFDGRVHLGMVDQGSYVLTDSVTLEKHTLKGTGWCLIPGSTKDEDVVLYNEATNEPSDIGDIMKTVLFANDITGERHVGVLQANGEMKTTSLSELQVRHRVADVQLSVGPTDAKCRFTVFAFARSRVCGAVVFWTASDLYRVLQMTTYKGCSSKWFWNSEPSWTKDFLKVFGHNLIVHSTFTSDATRKQLGRPWEERCLPSAAVATVGVLFLLARFGHFSRYQGGLIAQGPAEAAKIILASLVTSAASASSSAPVWTFRVELLKDWQCRWPRPTPSADGEFVLSIGVDEAGDVDLSPLVNRGTGPGRHPVAWSWWEAMKRGVEDFKKISLHQLVRVCTVSMVLLPLLAQILWAVSKRIERGMGDQAKRKTQVGKISFAWRTMASPSTSREEQGRQLAQYLLGAQKAMANERQFSIMADKAMVAGLPLQASAVTTNSGHAFVCCPQVDRSFDTDEGAAKGQKRKRADTKGQDDCKVRQRAWLNKTRARMGSWRPLVKHRLSARRWILGLHNQLRTLGPGNGAGLNFFRRDAEKEEWSDAAWATWPHLTVCQDLGSDGVCGVHYLDYKAHFAVDMSPDTSHGANRDISMMLSSVGLTQFWLLMLVSWNLPFGPDKDSMRYQQIREAAAQLFQSHKPATCALFLNQSHLMLQELKMAGVDFCADEDPEQALWAYLSKRGFGISVKTRCNMNRFQGSVATAQFNLGHWRVDWLERTWAALELDHLKGRLLEKKLVLLAGDTEQVGEGGGSTSAGRVAIEDRSLRSCCSNAMVLSVMMLSDFSNRRIVSMVLCSAAFVKDWHADQNRRLRTCEESKAWLKEQVLGGYMVHVRSIMGAPKCLKSLETSGFIVGDDALANQPEHEVTMEDDYADFMGQIAYTLAMCRMKRSLWLLVGWPGRMRKLMSDDEGVRSATVGEFKRDAEYFQKLEGMAREAKQDLIYSRSVFHRVSVLQYLKGLQQLNWAPNSQFLGLVEGRSKLGISTQLCEDMLGTMKNTSALKQCRKFRRPELGMHVTLSKRVVDNRHRYRSIALDTPLESKQDRIEPAAFNPSTQTKSLDLVGLVSTSAATDWFSPSATNTPLPFADLQVVRDTQPSFAKMSKAFLGAVCSIKHRLAIELKIADRKRWYIALHHFPDSAVMLWPCERKQPLGYRDGSFYFEIDDSLQEPFMTTVTSMSYKACTFTWRSPLWQRQTYPNAGASWAKAVRPFANHAPMDIKEVASRNAWWCLSKTVLASFCDELGLGLQPGASLLDVLWSLGERFVPNATQEQLLDLVGRRLPNERASMEYSDQIMMLDEAVEVLDYHDRDLVTQEQRSAVNKASVVKEFSAEFREKAESVRRPALRRSGRRSARPVLPATIAQGEAKQWIPAGASIWRALTRNQWCGHVQGYRRITCSWHIFGGEQEAMIACIRRLWQQDLEKRGQGHHACPFDGIFNTE